MQTIRSTLKRLGWPADDMSDRQMTQELYRRWFACRPENMIEEAPLSVASAKGILISMASDGNLDSLCWAEGDPIPAADVVPADEKAMYVRRESGQYAHADRRRSKREPARDLIRWSLSGEDATDRTGWLIDRSADGMAFISPAADAPIIGDEIVPSIHTRTRGIIEAGPAAVVRTEPLNDELTLVCARLIESTWPADH